MDQLLSGDDRLEFWSTINRKFRMGSPDKLSRSTADQCRDSIAAGDAATAFEFLEYIHLIESELLALSCEWLRQWVLFLNGTYRRQPAILILNDALSRWEQSLNNEDGLHTGVLNDLRLILDAESLVTHATSESNNASNQMVPILLGKIITLYARIEAMLHAGPAVDTRPLFDEYMLEIRLRHDLLSRFFWAIPSVVNDRYGQSAAEIAVKTSFERCSFQDAMWGLFAQLTPLERAAFLAEHLRAHLSGPAREGTVEIVEEADRFELRVNPCGSGGAMRRDKQVADKFSLFGSASPTTWGLSRQVPAYCSHCALNEMASVRRTGRLLWVTEFQADPAKPCCWTIFKDETPAEFYERIGVNVPYEIGAAEVQV